MNHMLRRSVSERAALEMPLLKSKRIISGRITFVANYTLNNPAGSKRTKNPRRLAFLKLVFAMTTRGIFFAIGQTTY